MTDEGPTTKGKHMKLFAMKSITGLAFLIAGFSLSRSAHADHKDHLNQLAARIDRQAAMLLTETIHYRQTPNYRALVSEVAMLRAKARHMRNTTFCAQTFHHLEEDLRIVDRCFHRIESFFDDAEIHAAHGHGIIHGITRHVEELLNDMEDTIHHMQDDVRLIRQSLFRGGGRTVIRETTYITPTIYGGSRIIDHHPSHLNSIYGGHGIRYDRGCGSRGGIQINRGNFSFRIKF